ncbi:3-oxosteroid 1-dehydrogenase [Novosphingobium sp. PC22D]|uniref:FAD-dependent oxidoreductase n=1 Tax=Novosphingobium sp. PC22D TaxID=1962403 RepID=UPI000BF135F8|nr:FAD-dependent oxidoreductase [Novosphingobium sp. PC22D]PEQ11053.1 3-oxosteroid 1-dehydrogenase [Novosphingobium sp. PC22D]
MIENETFDVVVVGSGAAGAMAALRAADLGMTVLILEKAHKFGGTSATSGGVMWIPNHQLEGDKGDSRESTFTYLDSVIGKEVNRERLEAFVDESPKMLHYLKNTGVEVMAAAWPDYFPDNPGARADRSVIVPTFDGRELGDDRYALMREQYNRFKLFGRYAMDLTETFALMMQSKGWRTVAGKVIGRYWLDRGTRRVSHRDRRFTQGAALMGATYKQVFARGVELRLETKLERLVVDESGRVTGAEVSNFGRSYEVHARHGVVLAAGGFEWNQELRDRFYPIPGLTRHSSTPEDANRGEALIAAEKIGASTEHTEQGWWMPTMTLPMKGASNFHEIHQSAFDVGRPWSVVVNRNGVRFVDEACGYDQFGQAMVRDHLATGANMPCWLIFDAKFRRKFSAGGLMPTVHTPEKKVPKDWWDHYVFRADTIEELCRKVHLPVDAVQQTVAKMNDYARTGIDPEFGRGMNAYDQMFGDPVSTPNPNIGPIDTAPYYAVPINNGDLGTKGGLRCDARARVLDGEGRPIAGLYSAGNNAGTPFGDAYPGAGATIGPAMTFGYIAANDIAERSGNLRG